LIFNIKKYKRDPRYSLFKKEIKTKQNCCCITIDASNWTTARTLNGSTKATLVEREPDHKKHRYLETMSFIFILTKEEIDRQYFNIFCIYI